MAAVVVRDRDDCDQKANRQVGRLDEGMTVVL